MNRARKVQAAPQPNGNGHQVTYEIGMARQVHHFPLDKTNYEKPPHGAGTYHDPHHHQTLMDRIESYIQKGTNNT